ncbi:AI-2E family transporter [Streptomyces sp. NPDC051940]|uniref:AI-2E family transporter n=1 Tax=Streptomyces sp. NPDC051940 TaxID=3155675 RepID=UPI003428A6C9
MPDHDATQTPDDTAEPELPGDGPAPADGPGSGGDDRPPPTGGGGRSDKMPLWLPKAVVLALTLYAAFLLANWAFHRLTGLLLNILVAFFLALAIEPAVDWMAHRGIRRGLATALVFLGVVVFFGGFLALLGSVLADQVRELVENFPSYVDSVVVWLNDQFGTQLEADKLQDDFLSSEWVQNYLKQSADNVWTVSTTVLGGLFKLLTILLFAFYFAAEGPRLRRTLCSVLPPARQAEVLRAWEIAVTKTGGYLYSRGLMALISGVCHYIVFLILDIPYAPALAVWVGVVSQFVPTVGTYLAGALPMLLAFTVSPWAALWVLVFVIIYQQFENYVLQPKITSKTVDIHPAVAFGSVIAGAALMGAVGALIAIPATATLQGFLGAYVTRYEVDPDAHAPRPRRGRGRTLLRRMRGALRR